MSSRFDHIVQQNMLLFSIFFFFLCAFEIYAF